MIMNVIMLYIYDMN